MKKLIKLGLACLTVIALAACGGQGGQKGYDEKVLTAAEGVSVHAVGGWGEWAPTEGNKMEATSVAKVAEKSEAVAKALAGKQLEWLYTGSVTMTGDDAGWTAKALVNGEVKEFSGNFTIKALTGTYNADEQTYDNGDWIPDPHKAHVESLTPETLFMPIWQETADANGFSWADNPVVISGAATYTFVAAKYKAASSADVAGYGLAVIK